MCLIGKEDILPMRLDSLISYVPAVLDSFYIICLRQRTAMNTDWSLIEFESVRMMREEEVDGNDDDEVEESASSESNLKDYKSLQGGAVPSGYNNELTKLSLVLIPTSWHCGSAKNRVRS